MKKNALFFALCLISYSLPGQIDLGPGVDTLNNDIYPWTSLDINHAEGQFQFAIVTDRTGGHRPGVFMQAIEKLNLLQPEFVLSVGDLIEGYSEDSLVLEAEWDEFEGFISHLEMPFFYVPGNHDLTNQLMGKIWERRFGKFYYHFIYHDVLFLCLNSEDQYRGSRRGSISEEQFQFVKKVLEENDQVKYTFIFMHQPLWVQQDPKFWPDIEIMLQDRPHTVFVGHQHNYVKYDRNNGQYFILATSGGGSRLRGPSMGEFDHVVWVTMKPDGPVITNLLLEGILGDDLVSDTKKEFFRDVFEDDPIVVTPCFAGADPCGLTVRIKNSQQIPMQVELKPGFSWDLILNSATKEVAIPPMDSQDIGMELVWRSSVESEPRPVPLEFDLCYSVPKIGEVHIPVTRFLRPIKRYDLPMASNPKSIDGDLGEWNAESFHHTTLDYGDNEVKFSMSYDDDFLYLAAEIKDDTILLDRELPTWRQDGFGWLIAVGTERGLMGSSGALSFRTTPGNNVVDQRYYRGHTWPDAMEYIAKVADQGYIIETKIPMNYLNRSGEPWEVVRLNFFVDDKDSEKEPNRNYWQPSWNGNHNITGSGLFYPKR